MEPNLKHRAESHNVGQVEANNKTTEPTATFKLFATSGADKAEWSTDPRFTFFVSVFAYEAGQ